MSTESESSITEPQRAGLRPWKKGQSGNPRGRRAKGLATAERLRNALIKDLPAILKTVVENAIGGDIQAAKTILERVLPPLKAVEIPGVMKPFTGTLSDQGQLILNAMAEGSLAPGQGVQLLGAIAAQAKILEVDDLGRRLSELEKRLEPTNGNR